MQRARQIKIIPHSRLLLDEFHVRLRGLSSCHWGASGQSRLARAAGACLDLGGLAASIAANGFHWHEPLIVEPLRKGDYKVLDGSRRLAAVRLLVDEDLREWAAEHNFPVLENGKRRSALRDLPALIADDRIKQSIVFSHASGSLSWGVDEKAEYAVEMSGPKNDVPLKEIAARLGESRETVAQMRLALSIAIEAEGTDNLRKDNQMSCELREDEEVSGFSLAPLYRAIARPAIAEFIGLSPSRKWHSPILREKRDELRQLMTWLYGDRERRVKSIVRTKALDSDLDFLNAALENKDGLACLRFGKTPQQAAERAANNRAFRGLPCPPVPPSFRNFHSARA